MLIVMTKFDKYPKGKTKFDNFFIIFLLKIKMTIIQKGKTIKFKIYYA